MVSKGVLGSRVRTPLLVTVVRAKVGNADNDGVAIRGSGTLAGNKAPSGGQFVAFTAARTAPGLHSRIKDALTGSRSVVGILPSKSSISRGGATAASTLSTIIVVGGSSARDTIVCGWASSASLFSGNKGHEGPKSQEC